MHVAFKDLPKSQIELRFELSPEELKPYLLKAAAELSSQEAVPGFRPGKAPLDIVEKRFGAMKVYQKAAERAVEKTYAETILSRKLVTVGPPEITLEKVAPGNPLVYRATVSLLPTVELGDYRSATEEKKKVTVTRADVDGTLASLQKLMAKEKRVSRPARQGDRLEIDMETYVDSVPIDSGASKSQPVTIGEGHYIPGFEDGLVGLAEGQRKEFQLRFPKNYHRKDLAGRPVEFKVAVKSVMERELPQADDAFAKAVGNFEKLDDLRAQLEKNITEEKSSKEHQRWEIALVGKIISGSKISELPENLIDAEIHKMTHELEHEVTERGMKYGDYLSSIKKSEEDLHREFRPQAEKRIKTALVLRTIAEREGITVPPAELENEIEVSRQRYQGNLEVLQQVNSEQYREYLFNVMRSRKVFDFLEKKDKQ